jgi:N-acetylglucosaminyl-diphospho-decaprenol L-rhamnosyltransferase
LHDALSVLLKHVTKLLPDQPDAPDLTVVVVNYNTGHLFARLFSTLTAAQGRLRVQIIVIDNASRDNSIEILRSQYPTVELVTNTTNLGFGRANNRAVERAHGPYVLLLNTDAFVSEDTLLKTLNFMESNPQCGILGVKLVGEDGTLQPSCRFFPTPWNVFLANTGLNRIFPHTRLVDDMTWDHSRTRECDWVPGCFYLTRKKLIDQVGLFDPRFFLYYEEVDHCHRARQAGWKVYFYANTSVVHVGGESAKTDAPISGAGRQVERLQIESELLYFRKHFGLRGVFKSIVLTAFGASMARVRDAVRSTKRSHQQQERLTIALSLLRPTRWASRATR